MAKAPVGRTSPGPASSSTPTPSGHASTRRSCTRPCGPSSTHAARARPPRSRAPACAAAAPSRGARRAPAAPAPARSARRSGPAAASTFGPQPRHYTVKVNRKARRAALRSALSRPRRARLDRGARRRARSTRPRRSRPPTALAKWDQPAPTLVVLARGRGGGRQVVPQPSRRHRCCPRPRRGVADLIGAASLVVSEAALAELTARAKGEKRAEEAA